MMETMTSTYTPLARRIRQAAQFVGDYFDDEKMSPYPILAFLSNKLDRPPSVLAHSFLLLLLSGVLLNPYHLSGVIVNILGLLWPGWLTIRHISSLQASSDAKVNPKPKFLARARVRTTRTGEKEWPSQTKRLIDYWILYSFSTVVESTVAQDTLLALIPLWWAFKILAIVWGSISLSLGAADAAGASSGAKEKTRPRPLKLRTNSNLIRIPSPTIAKTSQTAYGDIDSSSSSSSPSQHSSSATAVDTSYTNPYPGISTGTGTGTGTRTGAAAETGPTPNSPELQASRDELGQISPVLSRTPEHLRPRHESAGPEGKEEGPATATSEYGSGVFGLSEVDRESEISDSDSDSDTGPDSDSNSETDPGSGSESDSNTNSDSDARSDSDPNAPFSDSSPLPRPPSPSPSLATNPTSPNTSARPSHSNNPNPNPNPITANAANAAFTDDSNDIRLPLDTPLDELALRGLKTIELEVEEEEEEQDGDGQAEIGHWEGREGREKEKSMKIDPAPVPSSPGNPTKPPATRPQNPLGEMGEGSITRLTLDDLLALEDNGSFSPPPPPSRPV
ncbi:hypothetical protein CNL05550 [Cryptococcus deneoformans JEC21]|uniref:Uncharacterized protein n=1 Tax=Cryptococcus deneoformans (strain JEC21 / ATCC MYA-565) TaxID=214684 RepID=Q5K8I6_CRYD1|nr:hypothetical protein CNL05550 [Cryptococcus neoformans var. neoformans JEC21]AAW46574.2 hypothetical protein CNL05550 [Cryptococcus neoformans var. neoformans JEC21]